MEADEIAEYLKEQYLGVRILPDGSVAALHDLLTTRSVMLGCDEWSFKRRFCFSDRSLADKFFYEVESEKSTPASGYVARRPEVDDQADPYLNALHNRPWNKQYEGK